MSDKLWILWVTTVPATIITVVFWRTWIAHNDSIMQFLTGWRGRAHALFKQMEVHRQKIPEKTGQP